MTEKELRELNCFCMVKILGWKESKNYLANDDKKIFYFDADGNVVIGEDDCCRSIYYTPTKIPAAAMEVLKKCIAETGGIESQLVSENWWCVMLRKGKDHYVAKFAETLELAICLFAKKLFSK